MDQLASNLFRLLGALTKPSMPHPRLTGVRGRGRWRVGRDSCREKEERGL